MSVGQSITRQKINHFHGQIRSQQRESIKKEIRIQKIKEITENILLQRYIEQKTHQQNQQQQRWKDLLTQFERQDTNFWNKFSVENQIQEILSQNQTFQTQNKVKCQINQSLYPQNNEIIEI